MQSKWLSIVVVVIAGLAAGSVLTTAQTSSVVYEARSAKVVADGKTDDSTALENAIASAIAGNYGTIQLPCGQIMVTKAINLTNRSNLTLQGCGSNQDYGNGYPKTNTQILCNTGTVCLDTTGSSRLTLKDFSMRVARNYSTPSTVGILLGRDNAGGGGNKNPLCFAQWNTLDHLYIYMDSSPTVTPRGRIAIYNVAAEHFTIKGGKYIADQPLELADTNILAVSSPYQTLHAGCPASMTVANIGEGVSFQPWKYFAVEFNNVMDVEFTQVHYMCGGPSTIAVNFNSGRNNKIGMKGQVEQCAQFANTNTDLDHDTFEVLVVGPKAELIGVHDHVNITSSTFKIGQEHGQPQLLFGTGSADTISGSYIDLGTLRGVNSPGIKVTSSIVMAPGHQDAEIKFAPGSQYLLLDDEGLSAVGGLRSH